MQQQQGRSAWLQRGLVSKGWHIFRAWSLLDAQGLFTWRPLPLIGEKFMSSERIAAS